MADKIIQLNEVSLIDLWGAENRNLKELMMAFPKARIVPRNDWVRVIGTDTEVDQINAILNQMVKQIDNYGYVTLDHIKSYIHKELPDPKYSDDGEVILFGNKGLVIKAKTANQRKLVNSISKNDLVFAIGPAGTGKTYISVALAVKALKEKVIKKIIITRPAVEAGESLGFLPGDLKDKVDPYLRPIYDALDDMIPADRLKALFESRVIEVAPLAFMRGRTLASAYILLDEAQNTTTQQMKMFLTRMGQNSKMIVTGDKSQVDLPNNKKSGLAEAIHLLKGLKGIGVIELTAKDVQRNKLVEKIINAYDKNESNA